MFGGQSNSRNSILRNLGYLFIWGDVYRIFFGVHALVVGTVDLEAHVSTYLAVFLPIFEAIASVSTVSRAMIDFIYGLPPVPVYFGGFLFSTTVGLLLVRKSNAARSLN